MTDEEILERFGTIRSWTKGDMRAPHKPLLVRNFPESMHDDILDAVGSEYEVLKDTKVRPRTAAFRATIMRIYEGQCAMCGFGARLGNANVGVEAAHVRPLPPLTIRCCPPSPSASRSVDLIVASFMCRAPALR